jgi:hypothetical protein
LVTLNFIKHRRCLVQQTDVVGFQLVVPVANLIRLAVDRESGNPVVG